MSNNLIGGSIVWDLDVDESKLKTGLDQSKQKINKFADDGEKRISTMSKDISQSFQNAADSMNKAGDSLIKLGAAPTAALALSVTRAVQFETAMSNISTLISGDSTPVINELSDAVLELSKRMPKSVDELGGSLYDILSAGIQGTANQMGVLESSAKLATAGLGDTKGATDIMTSAINAFGLDAENSGKIADVLFKTVKFGKCFAKGTKIMMSDGSVKNVEDILVGDKIMGDDSTSRNIIALGRGREIMYKVTNRDKTTYTVNESHILALTTPYGKKTMTVKEFYESSNYVKRDFKGYKAKVDFKEEKEQLIDPRYLGMWLGDGHSDSARITTADIEVADYIKWYADKLNLGVTITTQKDNNSDVYAISTKRDQKKKSLTEMLRDVGVLQNKHIPFNYKTGSERQRLELLAGLIDTDGWGEAPKTFGYCTKVLQLAEDVAYLSRSLGFFCSIKERNINKTIYYYLTIGGNIEKVPCLLTRKIQKSKAFLHKNVLTGVIKVEKLQEDDYYGFEIDGNHLFLLGDFTVTHNTTVDQMAQSFGASAPVIASAKISLEEFSAATAALTTTGLPASQAQNSLRQSVVALQKPTKEMSELFAAAGIKNGKLALEQLGLVGTMEAVTKAANGNSETLAKAWGSVEALGASTALTDQVSGAFNSTLKDMAGGSEAISEAFDKQAGTTASQMSMMKNNLDAVAITIGKAVLPAINSLLDKIIPMVQKFADFAEKNPKLITTLLGVGAAMTGIGIALKVVSVIFSGFSLFTGIIGNLMTLLPLLVSTIGGIGAPVLIVVGVIAALIAIGVLLYKNWDVVKEKAIEIWNSIVGFFKGIPDAISKIWESIKQGVSDFLNGFVELITYWIPFGIGYAIVWFQTLPTRIKEAVTNAFNNIKQWGIDTWNFIKVEVPKWINNIFNWFKELPGKIKQGLSNLGSTIKGSFSNAWSNLVNEISQWPSRIWDWGKNVANSFVDGFKNALSGIARAFTDGINSAKSSMKGNSPPKDGPLKHIDKWGTNIGQAWVDGFAGSIGSLSSLMNSSLAQLQGVLGFGDINVAGVGNSGGGNTQNVTINGVTVQDKGDIDALIRQMGFKLSTI